MRNGARASDRFTVHNDKVLNKPEVRNGKGSAPAPGAVFRASRKNVGRSKKFQAGRLDDVVRSAGRGARPATPVAGVLPNFGIRV